MCGNPRTKAGCEVKLVTYLVFYTKDNSFLLTQIHSWPTYNFQEPGATFFVSLAQSKSMLISYLHAISLNLLQVTNHLLKSDPMIYLE